MAMQLDYSVPHRPQQGVHVYNKNLQSLPVLQDVIINESLNNKSNKSLDFNNASCYKYMVILNT